MSAQHRNKIWASNSGSSTSRLCGFWISRDSRHLTDRYRVMICSWTRSDYSRHEQLTSNFDGERSVKTLTSVRRKEAPVSPASHCNRQKCQKTVWQHPCPAEPCKVPSSWGALLAMAIAYSGRTWRVMSDSRGHTYLFPRCASVQEPICAYMAIGGPFSGWLSGPPF